MAALGRTRLKWSLHVPAAIRQVPALLLLHKSRSSRPEAELFDATLDTLKLPLDQVHVAIKRQ